MCFSQISLSYLNNVQFCNYHEHKNGRFSDPDVFFNFFRGILRR